MRTDVKIVAVVAIVVVVVIGVWMLVVKNATTTQPSIVTNTLPPRVERRTPPTPAPAPTFNDGGSSTPTPTPAPTGYTPTASAPAPTAGTGSGVPSFLGTGTGTGTGTSSIPPLGISTPPRTDSYVVKAGDTYWRIAQDKYGRATPALVKALQDANPNAPANRLRAGLTLKIPADAGSAIAAGGSRTPTTGPAVTTRPSGGAAVAGVRGDTHPAARTPAATGTTGGTGAPRRATLPDGSLFD
jgi:LysM repeat protein